MSIADIFEYARRAAGLANDGRQPNTATSDSNPSTPVPANSARGSYGPAAAAARRTAAFSGGTPEVSAGGEDSGRLAAPVQDSRATQPRGQTGPGVGAGAMKYGVTETPSRGKVADPAGGQAVTK